MKLRLFIALCAIFSLSANAERTFSSNDTIKLLNLNEVIVTSSTKETNQFKQIPAAASIVTPQAISGRQITAIKDITAYVPNLYIPNYGSKMTSAIYLRGIGTRASGQSIGLYVDDMPYFDKSTFDFELSDIQRIEVLRGPQGTLYGRNAMGGIINIYTLSPMDYQGTKVSLSGGNYGVFKAKASHYNKLRDNIGISVSAYYDRNSGFFNNEYTNEKVDSEESFGGRLKLEWQTTQNLFLSYTLSADRIEQGAFPYRILNGETGVLNPVNINRPSTYERTTLANNFRLEYKTDNFLLTSTTGYQLLDDDAFLDQDFSALDIYYMNQRQDQHVFNEEITIKSLTSSNYQWSFGANGFYNDHKVSAPVTFPRQGIQMVLEPGLSRMGLSVLNEELPILSDFKLPSYGAALFHQSTYNNLFVEGLSITAGVRLDYEKQELDFDGYTQISVGRALPDGTIAPVPGVQPTIIAESLSQDFWQFLPKVSLKYQIDNNSLVYTSISKGYKSGGYNIQMSPNILQERLVLSVTDALGMQMPATPVKDVISYKPEYSWNYEVGARGELIKNRLSADVAIFYMNVDDVQITKFTESGTGRVLANAGKAESYGAEASVHVNIVGGLSADINYGYTKATFTDFNDGRVDYSGNVIPYTPNHTFSSGLNYSKLIRNCFIDQFTASAQYTGAGRIYWNEANTDYQSFVGTVNAKVGVRKGSVRVDLWSRNLTGEDYSLFSFVSNGNTYHQHCRPAQFGVDLSYSF
jgi:Outer membrane receptor proteins, mostly Fe transport